MTKDPQDLIPIKENKIVRLELAKGLYFQLTRIGYEDEGIRLTFFDNIPFKLSFEVQLSKKDTKELIEQLKNKLEKWK